tara:strand:+ start:3905 stop:5002 length:1098 start_codon:yes stop_codon:yes gene_type:complete
MNVGFYLDEMNLRGIVNSTYLYALNNKKILGNKSIIFYNKKNHRNKKDVIKKFKKKFIINSIESFQDINNFKEKYKLDFIYTQKGGEKDSWIIDKIRTLVHAVYPQKINQVHGYKYVYASEWLSKKFSNGKIPFVPYMVEVHKTKNNLRKILNIDKKQIVFGCHGGESSFDLKFTYDVIKKIVYTNENITFLFLNIEKFYNHPKVKFLKGTTDEVYKKKFLNTCDAMIYGRSLGESFGLACAEFALQNKPIISYRFNRHQNHKFSISSKFFLEYGSFQELYNLLDQFKKINKKQQDNKYKKLNAKKVIKDFEKYFLKNDYEIKFNLFDYLISYLNFFKMHYFYLRHKLYNHYYNYFESKFFKFKD